MNLLEKKWIKYKGKSINYTTKDNNKIIIGVDSLMAILRGVSGVLLVCWWCVVFVNDVIKRCL